MKTTGSQCHGTYVAAALSMVVSICGIAKGQADSVYLIRSDVVIVEAEELAHSANWKFSNVDTYEGRFTGRGYLTWSGPTQTCAALGQPEDNHHNDITGRCQGNESDWLRVPVYIERVGSYITDLHNLHLREDGDNDVWTHVVDWPPTIVRVGSHHPGAFGWLSWGPPLHSRWGLIDTPGLYWFYVAGRSRGFSVDRIAIYRKTAPDSYPPEAHDLLTPPSTKVAFGDIVSTVSGGAGAVRRDVDERHVRAALYDLRGRAVPQTARGVCVVMSDASMSTTGRHQLRVER